MKFRPEVAIDFLLLIILAVAAAIPVCAETGYEGWLRYAPLDKFVAQQYGSLPNIIVVTGESPILASAQEELSRGLKGMLGRTLTVSHNEPNEPAIVLVTITPEGLRSAKPGSHQTDSVSDDAFWIMTRARVHNVPCLVIKSATDRGVLYGVFALLSAIGQHEPLSSLNRAQEPSAPIRWIDQWDNLDGTIERG